MAKKKDESSEGTRGGVDKHLMSRVVTLKDVGYKIGIMFGEQDVVWAKLKDLIIALCPKSAKSMKPRRTVFFDTVELHVDRINDAEIAVQDDFYLTPNIRLGTHISLYGAMMLIHTLYHYDGSPQTQYAMDHIDDVLYAIFGKSSNNVLEECLPQGDLMPTNRYVKMTSGHRENDALTPKSKRKLSGVPMDKTDVKRTALNFENTEENESHNEEKDTEQGEEEKVEAEEVEEKVEAEEAAAKEEVQEEEAVVVEELVAEEAAPEEVEQGKQAGEEEEDDDEEDDVQEQDNTMDTTESPDEVPHITMDKRRFLQYLVNIRTMIKKGILTEEQGEYIRHFLYKRNELIFDIYPLSLSPTTYPQFIELASAICKGSA